MPAKRKTQHQDEGNKSPGVANVPSGQLASGASSVDARIQEQLQILNNSSGNVSAQAYARSATSQADQHGSAAPAHGFANGAVSSAPDALGSIASSDEAHIHPDLRGRNSYPSPIQSTMPAPTQPIVHAQHPQHGLPVHHTQPGQPSTPSAARLGSPGPGATSPSALLPPSMPGQEPDIPEEDTTMTDSAPVDGRRTVKRELSQSKRAAQNRAAQRAFRQRKEGYIKKLEQQVREYTELDATYKQMQADNFAYREYVLLLRSCLMDAQIECPPPPPGLSLAAIPHPAGPGAQEPQPMGPPVSHGHPAPQPVQGGPAGPETHVQEQQHQMDHPREGAPLDTVAQAVASLAVQAQLANKEYGAEHIKQDRRDDDDAQSQLQHDAHAAPTASM
ncbi:hypothetical protein B0T11DRAFT_271057 [Plectosphaerella cucumerina]|uniref:Putative transcription factor kapC n=1 Tax=Plectosphaerella cucumerina TaxID=40658 RepID=A0A8K0TSD1_9PEZI|nr:hypothetical protein B0T11DRAFT_271057 [Plectosphaerella cucumerina]